jgi:hypothetical protein
VQEEAAGAAVVVAVVAAVQEEAAAAADAVARLVQFTSVRRCFHTTALPLGMPEMDPQDHQCTVEAVALRVQVVGAGAVVVAKRAVGSEDMAAEGAGPEVARGEEFTVVVECIELPLAV